MRNFVFLGFLLISLPAMAQNSPLPPTVAQDSVRLIRTIAIQGFVLQDKKQFADLFKPHRNKHLSAVDIDAILQRLQEMYEQAGYQGLVSIEHHENKRVLTFVVTLIK